MRKGSRVCSFPTPELAGRIVIRGTDPRALPSSRVETTRNSPRASRNSFQPKEYFNVTARGLIDPNPAFADLSTLSFIVVHTILWGALTRNIAKHFPPGFKDKKNCSTIVSFPSDFGRQPDMHLEVRRVVLGAAQNFV